MSIGVAQDGAAIFAGKGGCFQCHSIQNRGGSLGPDLSDIGVTRTPESLRLALTDPDAEIAEEYFTVVVTTKDGRQMEGVCLNEDDLSIQLRDSSGNPHSFLKDGVKQVRRERRSLMPSYAGRLSGAEMNSLVAYLRSLRGATASRPGAGHTREIAPITTDISWMTRANRDSQERPDMLLDSLRIGRGATVVDLGAGAGYFTWRLAQRVGPEGKVIAVDIQQKMLDLTAQELKKRQLGNVRLVLGTESDPGLPAGAVDLVLIANAYHEFSQPEAMLAAVVKCLKPDGRVAVIEYATENDEDPTAGVYTMRLPELRAEFEAAGLQLDRVLDFLPLQHGLIFTRAQNR